MLGRNSLVLAFHDVDAVADQTASEHVFTELVHGGHLMMRCECHELVSTAIEQRIGAHHERIGTLFDQSCERRLEVGFRLGEQRGSPQTRARRGL